MFPVETPTDRLMKTLNVKVSKGTPTYAAESQRKRVGQELRSSMNKVVGPGCRLLMGLCQMSKDLCFLEREMRRNDLKVTMGSKEIIFLFLTLCYLRGMQAKKFVQEAARFKLGLEVTSKTIEDETPKAYTLGYIQGS